MIIVTWQDASMKIQPVSQENLDAVLNVYQQCEDFMALGPVATASMQMALDDLEISKKDSGIFCGIHTEDENMIGVIDYIPKNYHSNSQAAYLSLLMIASPYHDQGIGRRLLVQ